MKRTLRRSDTVPATSNTEMNSSMRINSDMSIDATVQIPAEFCLTQYAYNQLFDGLRLMDEFAELDECADVKVLKHPTAQDPSQYIRVRIYCGFTSQSILFQYQKRIREASADMVHILEVSERPYSISERPDYASVVSHVTVM